ncbi:MAG: type II CRISPR-associated endonuclease Cas1 [Planctomycetaceae bacterium]|nr:type II CRISPR-associated endonuclease Cas1 [Planctomycetaceae bacterium]
MNTYHCGRIIEISGLNRFLKKDRGSLGVYEKDKKIGSVAFDDIQAVIFNAYDLCYTHNVMLEFAQRNIPVIFCDNKHLPKSIVLPFDGYFHQSRRMMFQAQTKKPLNKQLWKSIIIAKITQQAMALKILNKKHEYLLNLAGEVKSDDSTNCEGQAAKHYFAEIFGRDFIRDREQPGINTLLNYGYTILRSTAARAVVSYGLNPSIGIKHCNPNNSMPLVDDLMEPFRPLVDMEVYEIFFKDGLFELDTENKTRLVSLLDKSIKTDEITTTPNQVMHKIASSLSRVYAETEKSLYLPTMNYLN